MDRKLKKVKIRTCSWLSSGEAGEGLAEVMREFFHRQRVAQRGSEGGDGGEGLAVGGSGLGGATGGGEDVAAAAEQALATRGLLERDLDTAQGGGGVACRKIEGDGLLDERERRADAVKAGLQCSEGGGPVNGGEELGVPKIVVGAGRAGEPQALAIVAGRELGASGACGDLGT